MNRVQVCGEYKSGCVFFWEGVGGAITSLVGIRQLEVWTNIFRTRWYTHWNELFLQSNTFALIKICHYHWNRFSWPIPECIYVLYSIKRHLLAACMSSASVLPSSWLIFSPLTSARCCWLMCWSELYLEVSMWTQNNLFSALSHMISHIGFTKIFQP